MPLGSMFDGVCHTEMIEIYPLAAKLCYYHTAHHASLHAQLEAYMKIDALWH